MNKSIIPFLLMNFQSIEDIPKTEDYYSVLDIQTRITIKGLIANDKKLFESFRIKDGEEFEILNLLKLCSNFKEASNIFLTKLMNYERQK